MAEQGVAPMQWPPGSGEMAQLVRRHDWGATALGAAERWPDRMRAAVELTLASDFPTILLWGADLLQIYNDGYRRLMGVKHPAGLGQPTRDCWPEVWHINAPIYRRVLAGETVSREDALFPVTRSGVLEDSWFSLSYAPLRDAGGLVQGVFITVLDTTQRVLAGRERARSEAALRRSEERFRLAMEAIDGMVFDWDLATGHVERSEGLRRLLGYGPAEARADAAWWAEQMHPEDRDRRLGPDGQALLEGGAHFRVQVRMRHRDGHWLEVQDTGLVLRDAEGRPSRVIGSSVDVTARSRAEALLRESEARYRALVTATSHAVYSMGPDWTEMRRLDGRGFLADTERSDRSWLDTYILPEDQPTMRALIADAVRRRGLFEAEHRVRRADGTIGWAVSRATPLLDPQGRILEWFGAASDATERKQAEAAVAAEKERFRTLSEGIPQLVWRAAEGGLWNWASPQWRDYTGQRQRDSQGLGWLAALHPEDREATLQAWQGAMQQGRLDVEHRLRRAGDGAWRWHQTRAAPLRGLPSQAAPEGPIVEWLGSTTDIDDLKRLQGEQGVLVDELQHRTRNLLSVVRTMAHRSIPAQPGRDEYDARLAALSRLQAFLARSRAYAVPLLELVRAELQAVGDGGPERIQIEGPAVELAGGGVQPIALALHELATNAVKYGALSRPQGRLSVRWGLEARDQEPILRLRWRESGVPLPPQPPLRRGYGSELIMRALPYQLQAETRLDFAADGVRCDIVLPAGNFRTERA